MLCEEADISLCYMDSKETSNTEELESSSNEVNPKEEYIQTRETIVQQMVFYRHVHMTESLNRMWKNVIEQYES